LSEKSSPVVYVIAGPNGAGKTTFAKSYLPKFAGCREFVNADLIAAGLSPFNPESQSIAAGRLMIQRMNELAESKQSFALETTLAGRTHACRLLHMKELLGYIVDLTFLWLPTVELAIERAALRVSQGGHDIPEPVIRRRYKLGIDNFASVYVPIADRWSVLDGSTSPSMTILEFENGLQPEYNSDALASFKKQTGV
jgi:predicted ABC-type ATPase